MLNGFMSDTHAYLKAMDITWWVPRQKDADSVVRSDRAEYDALKRDARGISTKPVEPSEYLESVNTVEPVKQVETAIPVEPKKPADRTTEPLHEVKQSVDPQPSRPESLSDKPMGRPKPLNDSTDTEVKSRPKVHGKVTNQSQGYLVLPSGRRWLSGALTLVCRHEAGQPSESYILRGNPSKTVANLLKALNVFMTGEVGVELLNATNLAQLASTPLSDSARETSVTLRDNSPKALLVMGASTANHLLNENRTMGEWQVKTWRTPEDIPVVITYHPYEIYQSPILKKQVMQDLITLSHYLRDE